MSRSWQSSDPDRHSESSDRQISAPDSRVSLLQLTMHRLAQLRIPHTLGLRKARLYSSACRPAVSLRYYSSNTSGTPPEPGHTLPDQNANPTQTVDIPTELGTSLDSGISLDANLKPELSVKTEGVEAVEILGENGETLEEQVFAEAEVEEREDEGSQELYQDGDVKNVAGLDVQFPNLMNPDPLLDLHDVEEFPADENCPWPTKVIERDPTYMFNVNKFYEQGIGLPEAEPMQSDDDSASPMNYLRTSHNVTKGLMKFVLMVRRITQQTGLGKIHRMYAMVVVGNGNGLVGLGEGKAEELPEASRKALVQAVRNMDFVERFEDRTIWTEMETKLGATRVIMRPRPVGFGLQCNPNIHQILKAAGIKDISAKVWGSRNPLNVIKATFRMLQAGYAPLAMGDGIGGGARKLNKGSGVVGKEEIERMRGRKLIDLRTR
jgi:small subunit ribosomal protein S5